MPKRPRLDFSRFVVDPKATVPPMIEVYWEDSDGRSGWTPYRKLIDETAAAPLVCRSCGYLLNITDDRITIVQNLTWEDLTKEPAAADQTMTIPKSAIVRILVLASKESGN